VKTRVHLINPPAASGVDMVREGRCMQRAGAWTAVWPPISLATIASLLMEEDLDVRLDDCIIESAGTEDLMKRVRVFGADLFVLNTATGSIVSDLKLADRIKLEAPDSIILAIGIHVTALPKESLDMAPGLDAIVSGEPELTVRDAAIAIRDGQSLNEIPGLVTRESTDGKPVAARESADLDKLPFPAWQLIQTDLYRLPFSGNRFLMVGTSRGCPFHCIFCADPTYYGHKLRTKSPERIVEELRRNVEEFGVRDFLFWSESFTLKREWTVKVLEAIIDSGLNISFVVNSRTDHVDPELLDLLKKAGCWMIGFGIESGSQKVLDAVNKKISVEDNRNAVIWSKEAGLNVTAHVVLGYPGETEETMEETIDFVCNLPVDYAQFYCAVPFPGSELYGRAKEMGWLNGSPWEMFEQNFSVLQAEGLPPSVVMKYRARAYRRFYGSPGRIWKVIRDEVGIKGMPRFAKMLVQFRGWV